MAQKSAMWMHYEQIKHQESELQALQERMSAMWKSVLLLSNWYSIVLGCLGHASRQPRYASSVMVQQPHPRQICSKH